MTEPVRRFRTYGQIQEPAGAGLLAQVLSQRERVAKRLETIDRLVLVASGKGGVGKSALTANLAVCLARRGRRVGAIDADLNGPSLARMLGASRSPLRVGTDSVTPAAAAAGVRLLSTDLLLAAADAPVRWQGPAQDGFVWRGALEAGVIREFLADGDWGELDYLFIDLPPGTDRIERMLDLVPDPWLVLLVSTPSEAAAHAVAKSATLLADRGIHDAAIVLNMTEYRCRACGAPAPVFEGEGADRLRRQGTYPVIAELPFEPRLAGLTDSGRPFVESAPETEAAAAVERLADRLEHREIP